MNIDISVIQEGFAKNEYCWTQSRIGLINGKAVLTTQKLTLSGSDVYGTLHSRYSTDMGNSFSPLEIQPGMHVDDYTAIDTTPQFHKKAGVLLTTGSLVRYESDTSAHPDFSAPLRACYAVYGEETHKWGEAKILKLPDGSEFTDFSAGCTQRVDLENGEILLPGIRGSRGKPYSVVILRCAFDGENMTVKETSTEITAPKEPRGLSEPSLIFHKGEYYLTLRADTKGYVCRSKNGFEFEKIRPWRWDTGLEVPTYNTQQHWLSCEEGLFLVYTRKNGKNDHVFRNRAPLYMARVDTENLCLLRNTEIAVTPERGARMGNFGVTHVNDHESWIVTTEWMQPIGCEKYGSNNAVYLIRATC